MERAKNTDVPAATTDLPKAMVQTDSLVAADSPRSSGVKPGHARLLAGLAGPLPPIVVHRPTMRVIDGMHRLLAARLRGEREIEVRFFEGDEASAFVLAVQLNIAHGLPLSLADRKTAADRVLGMYPRWSDRAIASATGLSPHTVSAQRRRLTVQDAQSDTRIGQDNRARPVNAAQRRETAARLLAGNPGASLREVASQAGLSSETVRRVRAQLHQVGTAAAPCSHALLSSGSSPGRRLPSDQESKPGQAGSAPVRALMADPAFRSTENGRALLRLLTVSRILGERGGEFLDTAPAHCLGKLSDAARASVRDWQAFADEVDRRRGRRNEDGPG